MCIGTPSAPRARPSLGEKLQVVTVVEMSADEFPGEIAESYSAACAALGVPPWDCGYGLVLDQDMTAASTRSSGS